MEFRMMRLACVVGARPNFMKIAPILRALRSYAAIEPTLIHTGQHYDTNLSGVFFEQLGIQQPEVSLGVGSGSHARQTADIMVALEQVLAERERYGRGFDRVIVVGDVNSTLAASLVAAKLVIPVAHVEAGLRSMDRTMPEEINRIVTDALADMLFVSEPAGLENLRREGHPEANLHLVGNVMIDTLRHHVDVARRLGTLFDLGLRANEYVVVTLHRPSNVDRRENLGPLVEVLIRASRVLPVVFPVHPRTASRLEQFELLPRLGAAAGVRLLPPQAYEDFLCLTSQAKAIITDSGGLQEESTALGVPCLTMRANTERPITIEVGTSTLLGGDCERLEQCLQDVIAGRYKRGRCPDLWDGRAAERIAAVLALQSG
jgi:UDP-N-acetylglucosamine 2-epimerase (non-hydrolysing)